MKVRQRKTKLSMVIILIVVLLVAGFVLVLKFAEGSKPSSERLSIKEPNKIESSPKNRLAVRLPNAEPIYDVKLEYFEIDGIWLLVNKTHPLSQQKYRPSDLITPDITTEPGRSTEEMSVREIISQPVKELWQAAKDDGIELMIGSAFRSYDLQSYYYNNYVKNSGEAAANRYSAKPGTSEHQIGLAIDFTTPSQVCRLQACFADTAAGKWLKENAYKYGFILRYPENGESVTGYIYEPWHFRYIGKSLAKAFQQSGLETFEEAYPYLEQARQAMTKEQ